MVMSGGCGSSKPTDPQQAYEDSISHLVATKLLEQRQFVLTASRLTLGVSPIINVPDANNFIMLDGDECTVQMALTYNGMRPYTAKGTISNYKYNKSDKGDVTVSFRFNGRLGSGDVRIILHKGSNQATGYIDATFSRGRSTFYGAVYATSRQLIKLEE